jgi:hypothetical protein
MKIFFIILFVAALIFLAFDYEREARVAKEQYKVTVKIVDDWR